MREAVVILAAKVLQLSHKKGEFAALNRNDGEETGMGRMALGG
jgi:hypothetical protein